MPLYSSSFPSLESCSPVIIFEFVIYITIISIAIETAAATKTGFAIQRKKRTEKNFREQLVQALPQTGTQLSRPRTSFNQCTPLTNSISLLAVL